MKKTPLKTKTPLKAKKPWNPVRKPWTSKTTLKSRSTLKAKKPMNKIGKIGRANLESSKRIKKITGDLENQTCEISTVSGTIFDNCLHNFALTIAHRHKRAWYKGDPILLSDQKQWVIGCVECHDRIEHDKELTEKVFNQLRGPENE